MSGELSSRSQFVGYPSFDGAAVEFRDRMACCPCVEVT